MSARSANRSATHEGFLRHARYRWAKVAAAVSALAFAIYALTDPVPRRGGGTAAGYALGTVAALLIVWLTALGLRKRIIGASIYSLKNWTSAHVWLGLSLIVVATLHTGFQFGLNVHTLAYGLMIVVIASGLYGIAAYAGIPARLSANRGEATEAQMLEAIAALDRQLDAAAQPLGRASSDAVRLSLEQSPVGGGLLHRLTGRHPRCGNRRALAAALAPDADPGLAALAPLFERKDAALARARRHAALKARLEIWLYVHVPATFALLAALAAHILSVFIYW